MSEHCVFCRVCRSGSDILYQDDHVFVLLDISPLSTGHLLVVPKVHAEFFHELSDEVLSHVLPAMKRIVRALGHERYNILQNNGHIQSVPHVHFHMVPANRDSFLKVRWETMEVDGAALESCRKEIRRLLAPSQQEN